MRLRDIIRWVLYRPEPVTSLRSKPLGAAIDFTVRGQSSLVSDCLLTHNCDDPISEQDAFSRTLRHNVNNWYGPGFYTRRMPDRNAVVLTQTRWAPDDLSGFLLANSVINPEADQWDVLKISAEIDQEMADELNRVANDPRYEKYLNPPNSKHPYPMYYSAGGSFSPRRWPLVALAQSRGNMTRKNWAALYQQSPTEEGGAVFLREYWRKWTAKAMPKFEYILQAYDTAFDVGEQNDFSVRITFGVFRRESDHRYCVMVLEWYKARAAFPEVKAEALRAYKEYMPDRVVIEKAASGIPLIQELRKAGVPVSPILPKGSKLTRAHAATILFEQGCVYYPDRRWAEELIDSCASFTGKNDTHDDDPDTLSYGLNYLRRMFWVETPDDITDEDDTLSASFDIPQRSYARVHGSYAKGTA